MNELIQFDYPFKFFNEDDFSLEWVLNEIETGFFALSEYYLKDFPVFNSGFVVAKCPDLFKLGMISRICTMGEDYLSYPLDQEGNQEIRKIYFDECNENVVETFEYLENFDYQIFGAAGFPQEPEYLEMFGHDISMALNMSHTFYIEGTLDYMALTWLNAHSGKPEEDVPFPPFSKEGIEFKFRNVPIVRVW